MSQSCEWADQNSTSGGAREVRLDELSKYFHLPEKAVAKELGICLTSLKKLCRYESKPFCIYVRLYIIDVNTENIVYRSYGITRWPFRKLKSLERTMKKVQTEQDAVSTQVCPCMHSSFRGYFIAADVFSMKVPVGCPTPEKSAANPIGVTTANTTVEIKVKLPWFSQIVNVSRLPALDTPVIC